MACQVLEELRLDEEEDRTTLLTLPESMRGTDDGTRHLPGEERDEGALRDDLRRDTGILGRVQQDEEDLAEPRQAIFRLGSRPCRQGRLLLSCG